MLKRILNAKSKTISSAAFILGTATLASRLLGLLREKLLAHYFGAGDIVDIYIAAFRIPDFIFLILVSGILSAGFIPVFTSYLENKSKKQAFILASNVLNILMLLVIGLSVLLFIITPFLVKLIVPGFNPEKLAKTIVLTRILFLSPIILGISNLFAGILKSLRHFFIISLSPIFYNLGIIVGIIFFYDFWGIYGLILGVLVGALAHLLIQVPTLIASGWRFKPIFNFKNHGFRRILRMAPMRSLALGVGHINTLVLTSIASTIGSGSVAVYAYASNLQGFAVAIFGFSFAVAAFPTLSSLAAKKDWSKFSENISNTLRQVFFFLAPSSVLIFVLRAQIVRVILGSGAFDWSATIRTLDTLGWFALSMAIQGLVFVLLRAFYALENTKIPLISSLISVTINIILALILAPKLGVQGLALAFSVATFSQIIMLWMFLRIKVKIISKDIIVSFTKIIFAALVSGFIAYESLYILDPYLNTHTGPGILTQGLLAGLAGVLAYAIIALILRSSELLSMRRLINQKLNGNKE